MAKEFDVVVVGAGPGGYVAAIRSAQLGLNTAIVEREFWGGVCLNVGCIPSKAMIKAASFLDNIQNKSASMGIKVSGKVEVDMKQMQSFKQGVCDKMAGGVNQLLKGNKVSQFFGEAEFSGGTTLTVKSKDGSETLKAKNIIIATGSRPIEIPGFKFDEKNIMSSTGALEMDKSIKSLAVIGGGYIGLEIGTFLAKVGTEVTVVEAAGGLLEGVVDKDCVKVLTRKLKKNGVKTVTKAMAKSAKIEKDGVSLTYEASGKSETLKVDKVLVTVGRKPNSDQMNFKSVGVDIDDKGFIKVDPQMRTSHPNIYAIGDIVGQPMLAHKASHEGVLVAEVISGINRVFDAKVIPAVIFVDPEIAAVGLTEEECKEQGIKTKIGKFPFGANGKAVSLQETDGFVKIVADAETHIVKGVHIIGPEASNLISEACLAIEMGARLEDLALTIHPHPTLGETMMESAEVALGHGIHVM
ncbi:MAG: dihydrolipoyl dehydrogenase [Bdellovibrionales bacterium]